MDPDLDSLCCVGWDLNCDCVFCGGVVVRSSLECLDKTLWYCDLISIRRLDSSLNLTFQIRMWKDSSLLHLSYYGTMWVTSSSLLKDTLNDS